MDSSLATMPTKPFLYAMPAEIIGIIANQLVSTDTHGAWRLRGISKAFKVAIENDITLYQPKDALKQGRNITDELMPRYLFCRIHKHLDAHDALLARLKLKNEYLCRELNITDSSEQMDNLNALCRGQVKILDLRKVKDLLWANYCTVRDRLPVLDAADIGLQAKVAAAMSVRALPLLRKLLPQVHNYWFDDSGDRFDGESPLVAAVSLEDDEMLQIRLSEDLVSKTRYGDPIELWAGIAMDLAIAQGSVSRMTLLFDGVDAAGFEKIQAFYDHSLNAAIDFNGVSLDVVRCLLDRCPSTDLVSDEQFLSACKTKNAELIALLAN
ncbi:hypothetical protein HBI18_142210 [Parastagonospora nodorum]|nr:hypothetical protein HBI18_142210 [Parastagonospora nodorum]